MDAAGSRRRNLRGEGDRLRVELIEAATRVLARLGPEEAFSLRAVAREAKIAAPSIYIHFTDRNVLLLAVLERLFNEQIALRRAAEEDAAKAGGGAWDRLLAVSLAYIRFGLERTGHYKVLYEGRAVPRLDDPKLASFGRPLLVQATAMIREILEAAPVPRTEDPERLALLLWTALHGIVSLRINKPTLDWPAASELAEQVTRALIRPS